MCKTDTTYVSSPCSFTFPHLTLSSTRAKLHYRHHRLPDYRAVDDLGFLWYLSVQSHTICLNLTADRLPKPPRKQRYQQSANDIYGCAERRTQLLLLLSSPHSLHGLRCGETYPRQDHDLCAHPRHNAFCLRSHLRSCQPIHHA